MIAILGLCGDALLSLYNTVNDWHGFFSAYMNSEVVVRR
jgi:hypothetical protein